MVNTTLNKKNSESIKTPRLRLQGTRKIGCMANITVKTYLLYPEYTIKDKKNKCMSTRKIKKVQEEMLSRLRQDLKANKSKVEVLRKYFVPLPSEDAHSGHPTGKHIVVYVYMHMCASICSLLLGNPNLIDPSTSSQCNHKGG